MCKRRITQRRIIVPSANHSILIMLPVGKVDYFTVHEISRRRAATAERLELFIVLFPISEM